MLSPLAKVALCLGIELGDFLAFSVISTFSSQLYMQLGLNKLGLYILGVTSFSSMFADLLAPTLFVRFRLTRVITAASFGISLWVLCYMLPFLCVNMSEDLDSSNVMCYPATISALVLTMTFIGGASIALNSLGTFLYIVACAESPTEVPLFQSLHYSFFLWGKVLSSAMFAATMRSSQAQLMFFVCIAGVSLAASIGFCFLPDPVQGSTITPHAVSVALADTGGETLVIQAEDEYQDGISFWSDATESARKTLGLVFSMRMARFWPFIFYVTYLRNMKLGLLPVIYHHLLSAERQDRFYVNQWTGYVAICDSLVGIFFGIIVGRAASTIGKKSVAAISFLISLLNSAYMLILLYSKGRFGPEWFLAASYLSCALSAGGIVQFSVLATDLVPERERALGAGDFISSACSVAIYAVISLVELDAVWILFAILAAAELMACGFFMGMKLLHA